jgi:PAS domain S-box-containing protein
MWVYDLETLRFLAVNDAAVRHYGYSENEFLNMTIRDIRPSEDVGKLLSHVAHTTVGIDRAGVWLHRKKDGTQIDVEITSHVVDFGGRRAKIVLANDVTRRMKLEDQLRHAQKMEAVGLLAGGVAHDFNNVLTAIIGYGNLIQMKLPAADPLQSYAENIKVTAQRAAQLTQSLLAFSRKQVIYPAPVDLNALILRIEKLLKRLIREDIELRTELTDKDTTILADSVQIEQVLMNLITNARDAMPDGGVLTVRSETAVLDAEAIAARGYGKQGSYVLLTVSDTGAGMDARTRERVFEPFFTTKEMGKGTGLGLASVYGIVKQHQGIAEVDSEPGSGTRIRVYLPMKLASGSDESAQAPPVIKGGSETILIAEDDDAIRALTRSVLAEFGYRVIESADGEEAVRLFREQSDGIQLLLLDVIMPKKNGRAAFEEIRKIRPDIKVLFISGYSADTITREGVLEKGLHFVSKPLSPTELLQKVRDVLDS